MNENVACDQYMQITFQPEAAIYGKLVMNVNFIRNTLKNLDDAGASKTSIKNTRNSTIRTKTLRMAG